jgi:hypothetical protein
MQQMAQQATMSQECWSEPGPDEHGFKIRGPTYIKDKKKIAAGNAAFKLMSVDLLEFNEPTEHIASRPDNIVQTVCSDGESSPFFFIVNIMIPGPPFYSTLFYFSPVDSSVLSDGSPFGELLTDFLDGDDQFRDGRFKLIPSVVKGAWIVKQSVGNTPAIMGKKLRQTYYRGSNYFELDLDVSSSSVGAAVVNLVSGYTKKIVVDLAYLLEGQCQEELPEQLLGVVRLAHLDLTTAKKMPTLK